MTDNIHRGMFKSVSISRWDCNLFSSTTRKVNKGKLKLSFKSRFKSHLTLLFVHPRYITLCIVSSKIYCNSKYKISNASKMSYSKILWRYNIKFTTAIVGTVHVFLTRGLLRYSNNWNCVPHVNNLPASSCYIVKIKNYW